MKIPCGSPSGTALRTFRKYSLPAMFWSVVALFLPLSQFKTLEIPLNKFIAHVLTGTIKLKFFLHSSIPFPLLCHHTTVNLISHQVSLPPPPHSFSPVDVHSIGSQEIPAPTTLPFKATVAASHTQPMLAEWNHLEWVYTACANKPLHLYLSRALYDPFSTFNSSLTPSHGISR